MIRIALLVATSLIFGAYSIGVAASSEDFLLTAGRAGPVKIGMTPEQVESIFGKARIKRVDEQYEGMPSPALEIFADSNETKSALLVLDLDGGLVYRVNVKDPRYKTKEGIGVGSFLSELQKRCHEGPPKEEGEGFYGIIDAKMGMSFAISYDSSPVVASVLVL